MERTIRRHLRSFRYLLAPDAEFAEWRFLEFRLTSALFYVLCGITWCLLWGWDWVVDATHAPDTLGWRLGFLPISLLGVLYARGAQHRRLLAWLSVIALSAAIPLFIHIQSCLHGGVVWGTGGLMYCILADLLLFQCFSLRLNLLVSLLLSTLPVLCALAGMAPGFPYAHYIVLLGPATLLVLLIQSIQAVRVLDRYRLEQHLKDLTNTDALTGVNNRRSFLPILTQELVRGQRLGRALSVLMLDVDRFKRINDTHGHATGDTVLRDVAEICRQHCRAFDTVGRLGGDEFALLLPEADLQSAAQVAERIREAVASHAFTSGKRNALHVTISIGVADCLLPTCNEMRLLRRADEALLVAKKQGRNRIAVASEADVAFPLEIRD